jgi:hypothetical protein
MFEDLSHPEVIKYSKNQNFSKHWACCRDNRTRWSTMMSCMNVNGTTALEIVCHECSRTCVKRRKMPYFLNIILLIISLLSVFCLFMNRTRGWNCSRQLTFCCREPSSHTSNFHYLHWENLAKLPYKVWNFSPGTPIPPLRTAYHTPSVWPVSDLHKGRANVYLAITIWPLGWMPTEVLLGL